MKILLALKFFDLVWGNTVKYFFETLKNLFIHVSGNKTFFQYFLLKEVYIARIIMKKLHHYLNDFSLVRIIIEKKFTFSSVYNKMRLIKNSIFMHLRRKYFKIKF
jgi:hypothetical protein